MPFSNKNIPLHVHISYLFTGLMLAFSLLIGIVLFERMNKDALEATNQRFEMISKMTASSVASVYQPTKTFVDIFAHQRIIKAKTLNERLDSLRYITTALSSIESATSTYVGYRNGEFFMVRKWQENKILRTRLNPPANTRWVVQSVSLIDQTMQGEYLYYDAQLKELGRRIDPNYKFDPRTRPWYSAGFNSPDSAIASDPYYFATSEQVGVSYSKKAAGEDAVVAMDIVMSRIQQALRQTITPNSRIALINLQEEVLCWQRGTSDSRVPKLIARPDGSMGLPKLINQDAPVLQILLSKAAQYSQHPGTFSATDEQWQGYVANIDIPGGQPLRLLIASPQVELLAKVTASRNQAMLIFGLLLLIGLFAALKFSRMASKPLKSLTDEARKIEQFDFESPIEVKSHITEVLQLANAMGNMKSTIHSFLDMSTSLASETNFERLLARVLNELSDIAGAQGGVIYLPEPNTQSLKASHGLLNKTALDLSKRPLIQLDNSDSIIARSAQRGTIIDQLSLEQLHNLFGSQPSITEAMTTITLPLKDRNQTLVGVIVMLLRTNKVDPGRQALIEAISGNAAVAIENQRLIQEQKTLLEAFIQLIAGAIDAKSPYTGGHCQRVPELTKMLARAACAEQDGPYADFQLSEGEWEQLHIAAWLHDCGKVTTPEYVVDKATKLETLYDRIHEVRMRFEVLKRDAQINYWQQVASGGDRSALEAQLEETITQLDDDYAFIATCNEGGEFMAPEKVDRLKQIAARTWQRTLSDRIGISHEEKERKARAPEATLPATEPLLSDKPEHLFTRTAREQLPEDNPWGFKVNVPEYLYNRGEMYNLSVGRGTLSEEERYKINEHIIQTIIMLEKLPFPRHLARVPEIAGGHHEKMDGTGYPKRLKRDEMSLPARMMAIADIFEALTAVDRPYKKGKTLSEAIKIMGFMRKDQHIDADLFALFLRSGIYREYAQRYMKPEQIDEFDISPYLS
ncbi:GAF domain-containing protein [Chitinibacter bivalviorum]|uniref:GAF domain-containing protein n=1 Tax=Chitinibacter bivalviorum TaxID=2739434 RepID=A0A7H9BMC0_9NEIS|nr:HD domain-containing phosphohydrolase [Chitinibacter bivalviorum]QLG89705.1 GAF domain-containing protein [Chitinibacter bivalviorum]